MSQAASTRPGVHWHTWNTDTFALAQRDGRPILLSLVTTWSEGAREMDRSTFADARVVADIHEHFVPIRVDADERPDIADRYELGGIPTTAFLTPSGHVLGGGTFVDLERLRAALRVVAPAMARAGQAPTSERSAVSGDASTTGSLDDVQLESLVFATVDERHGGFGGAPKFPHAAAVRLALLLHADRREDWLLEVATRALDAIGWGELFDADAGGFGRCCAAGNWTMPQRDVLLGVNAALLGLYLDAAEGTSIERYLARASDVARFIDTRLRRHDGAWRVSADVQASRVFTDGNAQAASALLHAARVFGDAALGTRALDGLEHVLLASYKPGHGVGHFAAGPRGLLTDHIAMMTTTLDAWDETGNIVYRMMAEELAHFVIRTMWDERDGGLFDRAPSFYAQEAPGAAVNLKPFALNCQAAVSLRRLADATDDQTLRSRAEAILTSVAPVAHTQGPDAAQLLLARRAVLR
jgi:uncharacterized protein